MKRIAIIVSFAFNAAVVVGLLYGAYFSRTASASVPRFGPVLQRAQLTPAQRHAVRATDARAMNAIIRDQERFRALWAEGMQLLAAPEVDWDRVRAKQSEINDAHRDYQSNFFELWMDRARVLEPHQRAEVFHTVLAQIKSGAFFQWRIPVRERNAEKNAKDQ